MKAQPLWRTQVWRTPEGELLSCEEKIKLLNENLEELQTLMRDAVEEGILMGGDEEQLRATLHIMIDEIPQWQKKKR